MGERFDLDACASAFLAVESGSVEQLADWANQFGQGLIAFAAERDEVAASSRSAFRASFMERLALLKQLGGRYVIHRSSIEDADPSRWEIRSSYSDFDDGYVLELVPTKQSPA